MKRSDAIVLIAAGVTAVAWYAALEKKHCEPDQNGARNASCTGGGSGGGSGGGYYGGGSSGSGDASVARGGFGMAGFGHGGGGE